MADEGGTRGDYTEEGRPVHWGDVGTQEAKRRSRLDVWGG